MKVAVALLLLGVVAVSAYSELEYQTLFTRWVQQNDKTYQHEELIHRYNTFKANVDLINASNAANKSYTLAINKFSDLSTAEFGARFCSYKPSSSNPRRTNAVATSEVAAAAWVGESVDWRKKGAVTKVKDQGGCGSGWAFSTTGSMEGAVAVKTGTLPNLSEQQLIDCAGSSGNQGCNGGVMESAFDWIIQHGGLASQQSYPYKAKLGICNTQAPSVAAITSYQNVAAGDEAALLQAVNLGPVSVAVSSEPWASYQSGVFDGECDGTLDQGALVVGYGTDAATGQDYWMVKNSWSYYWGENGYIRVVRGQNKCGIAQAASYPIA